VGKESQDIAFCSSARNSYQGDGKEAMGNIPWPLYLYPQFLGELKVEKEEGKI